MYKLLIVLAVAAFPAMAQQYEGQYSVNPYATPKAQIQPGRTYKLQDSQGNYRGTIGEGRYAPDSTSNPYGRYGSKYSSDSINNPYSAAGSKYSSESPNNQFGQGLKVFED